MEILSGLRFVCQLKLPLKASSNHVTPALLRRGSFTCAGRSSLLCCHSPSNPQPCSLLTPLHMRQTVLSGLGTKHKCPSRSCFPRTKHQTSLNPLSFSHPRSRTTQQLARYAYTQHGQHQQQSIRGTAANGRVQRFHDCLSRHHIQTSQEYPRNRIGLF